jgi:hypothetical protein
MSAVTTMRQISVVLVAAVGTILYILVGGLVARSTIFAADPPCTTGTGFFSSATEGSEFHVGDAWQGGTFTFIENGNVMRVREESSGDKVGRFPNGAVDGDQATIEFGGQIHITAVFWWDNDPNPGEAGWSFNGIPGPLTGNDAGICTALDQVTDTVAIDAGGDSGGIDFWFEAVTQGSPSASASASASVSGSVSASPSSSPESSVSGGTPSPSPEQSLRGGTGTPAPSLPSTAVTDDRESTIPALAWAVLLVGSLLVLACMNVVMRRTIHHR